MPRADRADVCADMHTADGVFWPIPITLSTDEATTDSIAIDEDVVVLDPDDDACLPCSPLAFTTAAGSETALDFLSVTTGSANSSELYRRRDITAARPVAVGVHTPR